MLSIWSPVGARLPVLAKAVSEDTQVLIEGDAALVLTRHLDQLHRAQSDSQP
jgi:hypothetical protein